VAVAIAEAARAGIRTVMITGDHPATARAIAQEIGLWADKDLVLTGAELDSLDQQRLESVVQRVRVVARATAANKLRIVEALKARGLICAMTGDGVNDAPAVKSAHIGVAMGKAGTEVTKEAADLVLADDNYATIVAAVEEGRAIYANIRKFIFFLLSSNAGIVFVVLAASLFGWAAPLTPIQILWINLITNGLPALALGVDPKDPDQMEQPPRVPGKRLMAGPEWSALAVVGLVMAVAALGAFYLVSHGVAHPPEQLARARTLCFAILSISPMFHALNCRSQTRSIFQLGLFTNRAIWGAIAIGVFLQGLAVYVPPCTRCSRPWRCRPATSSWCSCCRRSRWCSGRRTRPGAALASRPRPPDTSAHPLVGPIEGARTVKDSSAPTTWEGSTVMPAMG
jgi:Ca2+-transporting ATPase